MKSFHMYTTAATGGRFRPTPILERERASFESVPHFGKKQIKGRKTGESNIQADADRCKQTQTVSLVDVTQSLDNNNYFPSQIDLVGSAKMLAAAYRLKCIPLFRPTHCN